jgi:hypothetical protein
MRHRKSSMAIDLGCCRPLKVLSLVTLLTAFLSGCAPVSFQDGLTAEGIPVRFSYEDRSAKEVSLSGDFNEWSKTSHRMQKHGDRWSITIYLPPGRYQYQFIIDAKTSVPDPGGILDEDTGFGTKNSVVIVE